MALAVAVYGFIAACVLLCVLIAVYLAYAFTLAVRYIMRRSR